MEVTGCTNKFDGFFFIKDKRYLSPASTKQNLFTLEKVQNWGNK